MKVSQTFQNATQTSYYVTIYAANLANVHFECTINAANGGIIKKWEHRYSYTQVSSNSIKFQGMWDI
jgi:hypothetical protein